MEKELLNLVYEAKKAAENAAELSDVGAADEVRRCVASLKEIKSFPVNEKVIGTTQADVVLRHLKFHNKERIRLMAKWLFETWRPVIKERITGFTSSTKSTKNESLRSKRIRITNDCFFPAEKKPKIKMGCLSKLEEEEEEAFRCFKKPTREPNVSNKEKQSGGGDDVVSIKKCWDVSRNKIRENLVEALSKVGGELVGDDEEMKERVKACDPNGVGVSVESVMFKKMGPFKGAMNLKYRSIMFNVRDAKNPDFRRKMLLGEIKPERLITISSEEMASDERRRRDSRIER